MHYVKYNRFWDTKTFTQAGNHWKENHKFYSPFPNDSLAYDEFWDEQEYYVRNGFWHEGQRISGLHYLYCNYCPIWNKKIKRYVFPDFRSADADWFLELEETLGLGPHKGNMYRPVGHATAKTRQSGHSLKGVVPILYNMHFVPGSKNYIGAHLKGQAQKTNKMYQIYHDHLFAHTAWGKRWLKKEEGEEYITGYKEFVNGQWIDAGFLSSLKLIGFSDSVEKGVGGGVDLFVIEEAGVFPNLIEAIIFIKNACKDGDLTTGNIIVYGAAGKLDSAADLMELSYHPEAYDFKAYEDKWCPPDKRIPGRKVIYFVPNYSCREPYFDGDGNPMEVEAIQAKEKSLEHLKKTNFEKYLQEASQMPNSLDEMFSVRQKPRFDPKLIEPHLAWLESRRGQLSQSVELYMDNTDPNNAKVRYRFSDKQPIWDYPITKHTNKEGCVEIFEMPPDNPPPGLFISSIDSYNQQDGASTDSLGCIEIYKKQIGFGGEEVGRILVAEYYARPDNKQEFYRNCLYLQLLYNAIALPENEDQELVPWYYNKGFEHMLADQPDLIRSLIPGTSVKRQKGIHAAWPLIKAAENKIQRYLEEQIGVTRDDDGNPIGEKLGVTRILSLGLMRELRRYVSDKDMNFDRVRTFGWLLMYEEETFMDDQRGVTPAAASFLTNTTRFQNGNPKYALSA